MKVLIGLMSLFFLSVSFAQHKFIEMNPPKNKPYMKSQVERMDLIKAHKLTGVLGETETAMLAIHDTKGLNPRQIKRANELMEAENKDRKAIFAEIARFNKLNEKEKELLIRSAYEAYRNTDAKGTYYFEKKAWHKKY